MDAIAHTQVSGFCLVTLAVLLRTQQKMRDKSLPGRQFTALLWFAGALTIVDYGSALAQLGAWEELGIPLTYRLNAGGSILFYLLAACCCQLVLLYVEAELGRTWMEDGRRLLCCGITLGLVCVYVLVLQTKFTVDTLTGVSNRIVALRYLESELPYYRRHPNRSLHFLMMDMDHFKHINDEYGHLEGDAALVLLAGILKKVCANYNGVLARYGGDEFCIACGCNSVEVRTLIASIQRELEAANAASGKPYQIEISIGCARLEPDIATVHDLIDKADQEMYHLKTRKHGTAPAEKQG